MSKLKFKTNINCSNCLARVSPFLNEVPEIKNWQVDLEADERTLIVETESLETDQVVSIVGKSGFTAEAI